MCSTGSTLPLAVQDQWVAVLDPANPHHGPVEVVFLLSSGARHLDELVSDARAKVPAAVAELRRGLGTPPPPSPADTTNGVLRSRLAPSPSCAADRTPTSGDRELGDWRVKKFLVVGVGGSGGATLRYLMDQLRADLRSHGIEQLPDAWQFLQVDVNPTPERTAGSAASSTSAAGTSRSAPPATPSATCAGPWRRGSPPRGAIGSLATWEPGSRRRQRAGHDRCRPVPRHRPDAHADPGRRRSSRRCKQAWEALQRPTAWGDLPSGLRDQGPFDHAGVVVPIVVGSIAGGSGASMFLDVCRVLARVGSINRTYLGAFLYSPDVFHALDPAQRKGIDGNALGALGELIAAQTGAADDTDGDLLEALGLAADRTGEPPFGRVFPIGSFIGGDGARFGDTPDDIYRGLGRALAATMLSEACLGAVPPDPVREPAAARRRPVAVRLGRQERRLRLGVVRLRQPQPRPRPLRGVRRSATRPHRRRQTRRRLPRPDEPAAANRAARAARGQSVGPRSRSGSGWPSPKARRSTGCIANPLPENQRGAMVTAATSAVHPVDRPESVRCRRSEWLAEVRANLVHHEPTAKVVLRRSRLPLGRRLRDLTRGADEVRARAHPRAPRPGPAVRPQGDRATQVRRSACSSRGCERHRAGRQSWSSRVTPRQPHAP